MRPIWHIGIYLPFLLSYPVSVSFFLSLTLHLHASLPVTFTYAITRLCQSPTSPPSWSLPHRPHGSWFIVVATQSYLHIQLSLPCCTPSFVRHHHAVCCNEPHDSQPIKLFFSPIIYFPIYYYISIPYSVNLLSRRAPALYLSFPSRLHAPTHSLTHTRDVRRTDFTPGHKSTHNISSLPTQFYS